MTLALGSYLGTYESPILKHSLSLSVIRRSFKATL